MSFKLSHPVNDYVFQTDNASGDGHTNDFHAYATRLENLLVAIHDILRRYPEALAEVEKLGASQLLGAPAPGPNSAGSEGPTGSD